MGKKIFRSIVLLLNFSFLAFTVYFFFIDGRNIPEAKQAIHPNHASISAGIEMIFRIGIRIVSIVFLLLSIIYYFDKRKVVTLIHIIILALTLLTTFIDLNLN